MWERSHWLLVGAIGLGVMQAVMIAALIAARARSRYTERRYALATAAGGVGVWDWNLETHEIYVDPFLKAALGYADHEIANHLDDWSRLVHPDDLPVVLAKGREILDGRSTSYAVEHRMLHRDGGIRWFQARGSVVQRNGRPIRVTGTDTDITDRKRSEQALHDTQAELARVSRLTALGEFAASIAHEVRQPLTTIVMNARASLRWLDQDEPDLVEIRAALIDVVDAGQRADELIRHNRELFRQHTVQREPLDINAVIRETVTLADAQLKGNHVALTLVLTPGLPPIVGDRIELQQVLLNLIVNAIDAMESVPPGFRRIDITTSLAPANIVKVSVRDNGVGLAGVDMQRMFSLSYTTKANGTGIGLSLSGSIVTAHGGQLWAEQNADYGATFCFTVPVGGPPETAPPRPDSLHAV